MSTPRRSRKAAAADQRSALQEFMAQGWEAEPVPFEAPHPAAGRFALRRKRLSRRFAGQTLVIPTGGLKTRSNDDDYRFRPGSDFYWLSGGMEPDGVLVLSPTRSGHTATLYVMPRSDQSTPEYFRDSRYGEMWIGPRRGLVETSKFLGVATASLTTLPDVLKKLDPKLTAARRGIDPAIDKLIKPGRDDAALATALGDLRLTKDDFEVAMLDRAIAATVRGFEDVVRALPEAIRAGERYVEGVFNLRARVEGNDVGYGTIAAAGVHATTLHWTRNNGKVRPGDLLLLDAGVEDNELYTADVTRTIPVSGKFTREQREIYDLVLAAQRAGIAAAKPGAYFRDVHKAATDVLAVGLKRLGIPCSDLGKDLPDGQLAYRYMPHGTSHMLGLDVHDCAAARDQAYVGKLKAGYVLTVEPGLYFKPNDATVPKKYRGIGIRIEDDVLITKEGNRVLSAALPTGAAEIEKWMAGLSKSRGRGVVAPATKPASTVRPTTRPRRPARDGVS